MKRSNTLTKSNIANPKGLGARHREPGYQSNAYPTVPTTQEEEVTPAPCRTEKWVQENKCVPERSYINERMARNSAQDDKVGQPPDYNQMMNWQPFVLKPNNQFQYVYQIYGAGLSQQQLSNASQQSFFASLNPGQTQYPGTMESLVRRPSEDSLQHNFVKGKVQNKLAKTS